MTAGSLPGLTILLLAGASASLSGQLRAACPDSVLTFDTSALERLVRQPERVLEDEEAFWEGEPAQQYVEAWAEGNGFSVSRERWRALVAEFAQLDETSRLGSPLKLATDAIIDGRDEFLSDALPHVCEFLPSQIDTGVPIYFTAFIPPRAFVTGGIVINAAAPYWRGNPDNILNALVHEIWHVGYSRLRAGRSEVPTEDARLYGILDQLQNEGTATYVAYLAQADFPAPDDTDYPRLDSGDAVDGSLASVNQILRKVGATTERRLDRLSWRVGVEDRAYYVGGAHMARTIDASLGRAELIATLTRGPRSFVEAYNSVAGAARRIEVPDTETIVTRGRMVWVKVGLGMAVVGAFGSGLLLALRRRRR